MKFTLIAAVSVLSTVASGLALPDLTLRATTIHPEIGIVVREDQPNFPLPPTKIVEVSRRNGGNTVKALLGFVVPSCAGTCTISFSDALIANPSRGLQLFTTAGYPAAGNTWNSKPYTNIHQGTFLVSTTGAGLATVVEGFGLTFPCPATTSRQGYEVGPVGDNDYVTWDITKAGITITCG